MIAAPAAASTASTITQKYPQPCGKMGEHRGGTGLVDHGACAHGSPAPITPSSEIIVTWRRLRPL